MYLRRVTCVVTELLSHWPSPSFQILRNRCSRSFYCIDGYLLEKQSEIIKFPHILQQNTPDFEIMADVSRLTQAPRHPALLCTTEGAHAKPLIPRDSSLSVLQTTHKSLQQEQPLPDRRARKSVAFSEDTTIMDANGEISESVHGEDKTTAESHSGREHPAPEAKDSLTIVSAPDPDKSVDEVTDMFAGLNKKKKKPSKPKTEDTIAPDSETPAADGEFDVSTLKKKKKKSTKPKAEADFDAKLEAAGVEEGEKADTNGDGPEEQDGDVEAGTGIWAHDSTMAISYDLLLKRFFTLVNAYNPDILSSGSKSYKIPPPQCLREGNKKTIFANIAEICKRMKRSEEHVTQFLFAELGTSGSVDGSKRLVIKGRFQQKQIENVLRRYIGM
jgi:translation initiation factor 2 subunit 2